MKIKLAAIITSVAAAGLLFAVYQPGEAQTYYNHDGSVDKSMSKHQVEQLKGKKDWWYYSVKVCANDYTMGVAGVVLKSDIDKQVLGVNKNIPKGECRVYGAVMKAKDGKTLGGDLIEKHEAMKRMLDLKNSMSKSKSQFKQTADEWGMLFNMVGYNPR
jgi:hypothetical protein